MFFTSHPLVAREEAGEAQLAFEELPRIFFVRFTI